MTWTISHGTPGGPFDGFHSRGYGQTQDWVDALLNAGLPTADLAVIEPLTGRLCDDAFEIEPAQAAAIATVLLGAVRRMPRGQREMTTTLAAAAARAAAAGEPWRWS